MVVGSRKGLYILAETKRPEPENTHLVGVGIMLVVEANSEQEADQIAADAVLKAIGDRLGDVPGVRLRAITLLLPNDPAAGAVN